MYRRTFVNILVQMCVMMTIYMYNYIYMVTYTYTYIDIDKSLYHYICHLSE